MKQLATIITAIFISAQLFAQPEYKITGHVKSSDGNPLASATIELLHAGDSSLAKLSLSNDQGKFEFGMKSGRYLISATAVSHERTFSDVFEISGTDLALAPLQLSQLAKAMAGVTVSSKKPFIEQKAGKTLINVDASPTSTGMNALELLEKSPGVAVDNDGNISLKGKGGVLILIDGKPSYLSGADLAALLKSMQSNNISQIEIMTNPPAKYDAAGNSGIINIKTKKNIVKGANGNITAGYTQGFYGRWNTNGNFNYRNNKINVFGGYGANSYEGYNKLVISRKFYLFDKTTIDGSSDQETMEHREGHNHNAKAGFDYYFSKKDVIGVVVNANFGKGVESPISSSNLRRPDGSLLFRLGSTAENVYSYENVSTNLNYKHTFDSTGRELSFDADYGYYGNYSRTSLTTKTFDENDNQYGNTIQLRGDLPSTVNIFSAKSDYVHPFSSGVRLEAGAKSSFVKTDNFVNYIRNNGTIWEADNRSNHFIYEENINAVYGILSKEIKKWSISGGLRMENTNARGTQLRNDSSFKRSYVNLFPNAGLSYNASEKNQFNFSYSRRIDRPNYDDLNPFTYFLDSLTYGQGNPYLQPQFTNNIELSHTFNKFLTTTLNYSHTNDVMTQLLKQDTEKKITYQTTENLSNMQQMGVTVMLNKPVTKWWNTNVYLNVSSNRYTGLYLDDPIDIKFTTLMSNINNNFTLPGGWSAELSGWYRGKGGWGLFSTGEMYAVNAGIAKQVLNKKGSVKLAARDIFNTQKMTGSARYSDVDVALSSIRDTRQVSLTFNYRFGKTNIPSERKRTGGAGDEQGRVKNAGN